nr:hypothetical protein BaRGS_005731 [Batillaria attramentaria]
MSVGVIVIAEVVRDVRRLDEKKVIPLACIMETSLDTNMYNRQQMMTPRLIEERRYADELISRQAEEIIQLKAQAQRLECEQRSMRDQYQEKLAALELEKETRVAALSDKLLRQNHEYEQQVIRLSEEHEGEVDDLQARLEHLSADLEQTKDRLTSQVADLTQELQAEREQSHSTEESLQQNLREKDAALQNAAHEIAEVEKQNLESSVQLMDVRLSSMKEILSTQEAELSKGKEETIDKNKLKELLLTRWRQKVYALLVQQKSSDLVSRKDLQNWQEKKLQEELSQAQQMALSLDDKMAENRSDVERLADFAHRAWRVVLDAGFLRVCPIQQANSNGKLLIDCCCEERFGPQCQVLQQAMTQLKSLGQRVSFASSRMELVKTLEDQRNELKKDWTEQMAEMERKLNDARREHTKAVVTVRQLERQMGRERERTQELQATMEAHNLAQLTHLQQQLQAVEKERNIFMATLRQEGLLGRLKSERGEPIRLQLQEEAEEQEASYSVTEVTETESQPPQDTSEPVSAVLEDLKALAPAVLDDTEESSDENQ